ncbi:protein arginine methyltransferase NDUFAF7, mitochondrial-like [Hydractinia symbiolongicarpus]|uniref:protein arginine methyltransferase NDUFAF7, mitochondrial-like n=1 Tax=Hydractinia symbiolongicarpus TaxID=13093 RepID=UPI00254F8621|nr:protein arginine methyltransferase NDUFAF7, mitochondrial-like [Hydractinia symbiolongicarpus]
MIKVTKKCYGYAIRFQRKFLTGRCFSTHSNYLPACLFDHLKQRIKVTGPITVSSYMKEALTNPVWGYYMKNDVFGASGDFITSPEISQMFGELIAIWFVMQWSQMGKPSPVQLVELGPGRGTLMADILRVCKQFVNIGQDFAVHFVEVSQKMIELQKNNLNVEHITQEYALTDSGVKVHWHNHIQDVPSGFSFYIAHEFFDALPVHLFRKINIEWREILINLSRDEESLEFVTAPGASPVARSFVDPSSTATECEVCPDSAIVMSYITENIAKFGGCGLVIDYGEEMSNRLSLRAFKDHKLLENALQYPGEADLTANVDFGFLKRHSNEAVKCFGPVTQQEFLYKMGIRERLQALMRNASKIQRENLMSSYEYLTSSDKMGEKFKLLAMVDNGQSVPPGFEK